MRKLTLLITLAAVTAVGAMAQGYRTATFRVSLSGTQEVPPIEGYQVAGDATFEITMQRDSDGVLTRAIANFRAHYNAQDEQTPVAMHIHRGGMGVNGPVVIGSGLQPGDVESGTSANIYRQVTITDRTTLDVVDEILADPTGFYLNVHSTQHPPGFVRGQLEPMLSNAALRSQINSIETKIDEIDRFMRVFANSLGVVVR